MMDAILCADSADDRTDLDDGRHIIDQLLGGKLAANVGSAIEGLHRAHVSSIDIEKLICLSLQLQGASCKADYGRRQ